MENEPHDLIHEFPEHKALIHELKMSDNHFRGKFDEYHEVNKEIHRAEQGVDAHSDEYMEEIKKKRLELKDALYAILMKSAA